MSDVYPQIHFQNPRLTSVGVEVLTFSELRQRASSELLEAPQRVDFLHILLMQTGKMSHMVDFVQHCVTAGNVLLVRPGAIQCWELADGADGLLVLVSSEAMAPSIARAELDIKLVDIQTWPEMSMPTRTLFDALIKDAKKLRGDIKTYSGADAETAIIRHELFVLLLRLACELRQLKGEVVLSRQANTYRLFARELENHFAKRWTLFDYAERLGFSESTLGRACRATVGYGAKEAIDRRTALEAKRLLIHSEATTVQIASHLGFSEATNFVKFFQRTVGQTPQGFRARTLGQ